MRELSIDLETFSDEEIGKTGLYKYAQSDAFEILLFAYSYGGEVTVIDLASGGLIPDSVEHDLFDPSIIKRAYNAPFEIYCLSRYFGMSDRETIDWACQWRCDMLAGLYAGYPAGLGAVGEALGLPGDKVKDRAGTALIRYFCMPCKQTKKNGGRTRNLPKHDPDKWALFIEYNRQDVVTEMAIAEKFKAFPVPDAVQEQWRLDLLINLRGVGVDLELVTGAQYIDARHRADLEQEAGEITGLSNPNSVAQLRQWLSSKLGEEIDDVTKDRVSDLLIRDDLPDDARRVLEIRQQLGKTSVKKYAALQTATGKDGRVRGLMAFYGANRTGREAGRLFQPQNLPHDVAFMEGVGRQLARERNGEGIRLVYGNVANTLSALIRTALVPSEGFRFIDADFSAIEARVIAWLAGEEWVLEVFRTHGKIYEATASQMFGVPIEKIKKGEPEYSYRAKGKVATLALGYQGGVGALVTMGALRSGIQEEDLPDIVNRWRNSNPAICLFWELVQRAAEEAVLRGESMTVGKLRFDRESGNGLDYMTILLPSGRKLYYASPDVTTNRFCSPSLCYKGANQTTKKWETIETYGGKLAENITQAVARDLLFHAMGRLESAGYAIVFDVHDEVIMEVPKDDKSKTLEDVVRIMSTPPDWAKDLPLNADGWVGDWFHKD